MERRWRRWAAMTVVILLVPVGLGRMPVALACSCISESTYEADVARADVVFDGIITEADDSVPGRVTFRFDVSNVVKGTAADPQDVGTSSDGASCGASFDIGRAYRVFARRDAASLVTNLCSGNRILSGYRLAAADGGVFAFGASTFHGSAGGLPLSAPVVGIAATPSGQGYWLAAADGGVFAYGDAPFLGSAAGLPLSAPVVGITPTPTGAGYWLAAADGGVFAYGDARFLGSAAGLALSEAVVGVAATGDGTGYWILGGDGGVFAYGSAGYLGRIGFAVGDGSFTEVRPTSSVAPPLPPRRFVAGIATTHAGTGYWISDLFGAASGFGDTAPLARRFPTGLAPAVGIARTSGDPGLVLASSNGSVRIASAASFGDLAGVPLKEPIVAVAS